MFKIVCIYTGFPMQAIVCAALKEASNGQAVLENMADDGVLGVIRKDGYISEKSYSRVENMVKSAQLAEPDLILGTCSSIGDIFDELGKTSPVPLLRIDLPMAEKAVEQGKRIVVVGTNMSTIGPSCGIVKRCAEAAGKEAEVWDCVLDQLFPILNKDGKEAAVTYAVEQIGKACGGACDVIMLAQASLTKFRDDIEAKTQCPTLASIPICAEYIKKHYFSD